VPLQISGVAQVGTTPDGKTILNVAGRPTFELNGVAANIWAKLVAGLSAQEIESQLIAEYGAPEELVARDVTKFIKKLKDRLLIYDDH